MKVGVAYGDVTPPKGTPLRGYYFERLADTVHDPLRVKAMVVSTETSVFVFVVIDIIDVASDAYRRAREHISQSWGIPLSHITISSTHTHTGPFLSDEYQDRLFDVITFCVDNAFTSRIPVAMKVGIAKRDDISFNRRYFMKDGSVLFNPGILNPHIVKPAGPIDPEIGILVFERMDGKPYVILVNFAIHLDTIGGTAISADFPYFMERELQSHFGKETNVFFAIGACGNVNHIDVTRKDPLKSFHKSEQIGTMLAQSVVDYYKQLKKVNSARITAYAHPLVLRTPEYTAEEINRARIDAAEYSDAESSTPRIRTARKILRVADLHGKGLPAEVQVVVIGSLALVMLPTEVFVELGLAIKRKSPFRHTMIFTFSNYSVGYIPDAAAFEQGAYEVEVSMIERGQGELLVNTAVQLLEKLYNDDTKTDL